MTPTARARQQAQAMPETAPLRSAEHAQAEAAIIQATLDLLGYCRSNGWAGYDPYDGLTSPLFSRLPFLRNRAARLVFIQFMKRSLINFRPLVGIVPGANPKALALFSTALIRLQRSGLVRDEGMPRFLVDLLIRKRTPSSLHAGWGYNFDWQNRTHLIPKYTPNVICTSFAGNALLDAYEQFGEPRYLETAVSAGRFILTGLNISREETGICFSYTPLDRARVHNANLLAAAFLGRLWSASREREFLDSGLQAVRYSAGKQAADGSWPYGEGASQQWIDNFHTGYNLMALHRFSRATGTSEFTAHLEKGFAFYRKHFFEDGCRARYYHDRLYPIDIHAIAQSIITLAELGHLAPDNLRLAVSISSWALENMRDPAGFFYYQKKKLFTNRISYMRWSQAWMLLALATLTGAFRDSAPRPVGDSLPAAEVAR